MEVFENYLMERYKLYDLNDSRLFLNDLYSIIDPYDLYNMFRLLEPKLNSIRARNKVLGKKFYTKSALLNYEIKIVASLVPKYQWKKTTLDKLYDNYSDAELPVNHHVKSVKIDNEDTFHDVSKIVNELFFGE